MLTKQNALFVTVRRTPKLNKGMWMSSHTFRFGYRLTFCDERKQ